MRRKVLLVSAGLLLLAGCNPGATDDRQGGNGKTPDGYGDMTKVIVWRNADSVPNLAFFCAGGHKFVSTLSGGDNGVNKASNFMRLPEEDDDCK